jgi:hypothetical protein
MKHAIEQKTPSEPDSGDVSAAPMGQASVQPQGDGLFAALIDRIAERVVEKLEERRKIDLIAQAVIQRIRLGSHVREATVESGEASEG